MVGLLGAVITLGVMGIGASSLSNVMTGFFEVLPLQMGSLGQELAALVLATGVGLGVLGSWVSVRSYLLK